MKNLRKVILRKNNKFEFNSDEIYYFHQWVIQPIGDKVNIFAILENVDGLIFTDASFTDIKFLE